MKKCLFVCLTWLFVSTANAALPYIFSSGGSIRAAEMNANFSYLENLASGASNPQGANLIRASAATSGNQIVYTVPSNAPAPYVIQSIMFGNTSLSSPVFCTFNIGSFTMIAVSVERALIPVAPGESIQLSCGTGTGVVAVTLSK